MQEEEVSQSVPVGGGPDPALDNVPTLSRTTKISNVRMYILMYIRIALSIRLRIQGRACPHALVYCYDSIQPNAPLLMRRCVGRGTQNSQFKNMS